ncbi:BAI1-associated protein 3-like [Ciona intestinalis]
MMRRRKLGKSREKIKSLDPAAMKKSLEKIMEDDSFRRQMYEDTVNVIVNRLECELTDFSEADLLNLAQDTFEVSNSGHKVAVEKARSQEISKKCVLRLQVLKAEHLAAKDVDGTSDPYCLLGVVPASQYVNLRSSKTVTANTSVINSTLTPEWNETLELFIEREQISNSSLQIQVWDSDEVVGGNGNLKKVKGVKGVGRYVKEVAQSVTKSDEHDDFMGFSSLPLSSVPSQGLERWFKLRAAHSLQKVSGRIKLQVEAHTLRSTQERERNEHNKFPVDVILAGILTTAAEMAHKEHMSMKEGEVWNANLPKHMQSIIQEFIGQNEIDPLTCAIVRWEVFTKIHLQSSHGVDIMFIERLIKELDIHSSDTKSARAEKFTVDILCESFSNFIHHECERISRHREEFATSKPNYVIALGSTLLCLKKLTSTSLYQLVRTINPNISGASDVRDDVTDALRRGTDTYYVELYERKLDESMQKEEKENDNSEDAYYGGDEIQVLIKLADRIYQDLMLGHSIYNGVFQKILGISYSAIVHDIVAKSFAKDASEAMCKVNKRLSLVEDPNHVESESKSTLLFRLYLSVKNLSELCNKLGVTTVSMKTTSITMVDGQSIDKNGNDEANLRGFVDWFRPTVLRWLQMSRGRTNSRLRKAVELDPARRVDDIVKHTSSAVDTIGCLTGIMTFWRSLVWPDPVDAYTIALRLTDDMANAVECYADLVHGKLKQVGFFDEEGQFDVTEELCLTLNNLQFVKSFLDSIPDKMNFKKMAESVERHPEGPNGQRVMATFDALINTAQIGMKKKIKSVTGVVGSKIRPDIRKYLRNFASEVTKGSAGSDFHGSDPLVKKNLKTRAGGAIRPLMKYLEENIITLKEWLCEPNFKRLLEVLWRESLNSLHVVSLVDFVDKKPFFFYLCRYILDHHLMEFFHAEGHGIAKERMTNMDEYRVLGSELKMRSAKTEDLIRLFYLQMYEDQQRVTKSTYGCLNVFASYDTMSDELHVDIISASDLLPLDVNGLSDPFVTVRLAPKMTFKDNSTRQTLVEKKTVNPVFTDESFVFEVDRSTMELEGMVVIFTVLDHDVLSANDLEGEAVLPLNQVLDGDRNRGKNFKLPLTQPVVVKISPKMKRKQLSSKKDENCNGSIASESVSSSKISNDDYELDYECAQIISPVLLLQGRSGFDKDAGEFCRWRRKLESSIETDIKK